MIAATVYDRGMADKMLTLAEAAAELGLSSSTLRWQIANGKLKGVKYGKTWVISRRELDRYGRENRRGSAATAATG